MSEFTLHLASSSDLFTMHIEWSDCNNVKHVTRLDVCVHDRDRQSELNIVANGVVSRVID